MMMNTRPAPASPRAATDYDRSPLVVFYEVTRACDLACRHCRACAQPRRHPGEMSAAQARALFEDLARFPMPPLLVITGGDPLKRDDLVELIEAARESGLRVALTPSATPLVTIEALARLHTAGVSRIAISLDGLDAATHDAFRQVDGSFAHTLRIMNDAAALGLPLQVNTTITRHNATQVPAMAELLAGWPLVLWSVFFLVPVGRGLREQRIGPEEYERVFAELWAETRRRRYAIKTTEAPHYRRFTAMHGGADHPGPGTNDGKGVMFISHTGQLFPSGFLPIELGRFPRDSVVSVYQDHPTMRRLRDADALTGKCRACGFRTVCGGSRARAYALTRDPLASDPDCAYVPSLLAMEPAAP